MRSQDIQNEIERLCGRDVVVYTEEGDNIFGRLGIKIRERDGIETITFSNPDYRTLYNDKFAKYELDGWRLDNGEMIIDILSLRQWQAVQPDEGISMSGGGDAGRLNFCIAKKLPQYKKNHPNLDAYAAFLNVKDLCLREQQEPSKKKMRGGERMITGGGRAVDMMRRNPQGSFYLLITKLPENRKAFEFIVEQGYNWTDWSQGKLFDFQTMREAQDALRHFLKSFPKIKWLLSDVAPTRETLYQMLL